MIIHLLKLLSYNYFIQIRHTDDFPSTGIPASSFKSRLDYQWCAYKYSNNNDFPPMRTNIKAVQNG